MLTKSDVKRLDSLMESVLQRRKERESTPERLEDKIYEILSNWEQSSAEQRRLLIESEGQFANPIRYQPAASRSENLKKFPKMSPWRRK